MNTTTKTILMTATLFLILITSLCPTALASPPESMRVWRVQIQFNTPNISDADSDDSVKVQLNAGNSTWLDYGRDDFERGTSYTYDLKLNGINTLSDIQYIYISKDGSDGWLIKSFSLIVNGRTIYSQTFPGNGRWLDNASGYSRTYLVPFATLRGNSSWTSYTPPFPPFVIPRAELESRIEGIVGDYIHGNELEWGHLYGRAVEATRKNANTVHVDLDLEADIPVLPNPEVDVDFDVIVTCANGTISLQVKNVVVDVDSNPALRILTLNLISFLDNYISDRINDGVKNIKIGQNVPVGFCPVITVDSNANVVFSLPNTGMTLAQAGVEIADDAVAMAPSEDNQKPLAVTIETGEQNSAGDAMPYSVQVKSNKLEVSSYDIQIELPAQAHLTSAAVEVVDDAGNHSVVAAQAIVENGKTMLRFRDYLNAGASKTYTAKMMFAANAKAMTNIVAHVTPLNSDETLDTDATIDSVTTLKMDGEVVRAGATLKQSAASPSVKAHRKTIQE